MINHPDWADLGLNGLTEQTRWTWDQFLAIYERLRWYFDGDVFKETVPQEAGSHEEAPLLFPVALNLVKMLCISQADSTFGEWEEQPVQFGVRRDQQSTAADEAAIDLAAMIMDNSNAPSMLWELDLDRQVYGGGVLQITPALNMPGHVRWSRFPVDGFFPIWDPDDPDELLEVYTVMVMSPEQARAKYGYQANREIVQRVTRWTRSAYDSYLDGNQISSYSGVNPWGVIPFVYIPRLRTTRWMGDSLAEDVISTQDEINMRIADISEAVNYNTHPVRWGYNLPRNFDSDNYPIGPNSFWNLGRTLGNNPEPKVGMLEAQNPLPQGTFDHLNFLYDWSRTSVFAPPIAFGEDNGGGQRSGDTLEIRMWPLLKATRRSRSYLAAGIQRAMRISALILQQKKLSDVSSRALDSILTRRIGPRFARILPRDQQKAVDEVVKLLSTEPPSISLETSQTVLGRGPGEVARIKADIKDKELQKPIDPLTQAKMNQIGKPQQQKPEEKASD